MTCNYPNCKPDGFGCICEDHEKLQSANQEITRLREQLADAEKVINALPELPDGLKFNSLNEYRKKYGGKNDE